MDYNLECEGLPLDDELEERLLLICRRLMIGAGLSNPVRMHLRQIEGRIQARVEVYLPCRRLTAVVWRFDPEVALEAAVDALLESLDEIAPRSTPEWTSRDSISTLQ